MIPKVLGTIFILSISLLSAQDYPWNITLASGDTISNISFQSLLGDSFLITSGAESRLISVTPIIEMTKLKKSKFAEGIGIGLLAGGITGALIGLAAYEKPEKSSSEGWSINIDFGPGFYAGGGAIIGGVLGMVIGGTVGASASEDEVYDLSQYTYEQKVTLIKSKLSP